MMQHCETIGRPVHLVNLDPAAENFEYQPTIGGFGVYLRRLLLMLVSSDVRELITLEDVMEELGLGPNGGLIYCMESV